MADELTGASLPEGIDVDEASAYFGVTDSSDSLLEMMNLPREKAFVKFFELLSDIVLSPGDFDFEAASERLSCEGGEIYYLVAGHMGIMTMPDMLIEFVGLTDSNGDKHTPDPSLSTDEADVLKHLCDPMQLLKLFAVAHQTGGPDEVLNYLSKVDGLFTDPIQNKSTLLDVGRDLQAAFDVSNHVMPIATLASAGMESVEMKTETKKKELLQKGNQKINRSLSPHNLKLKKNQNLLLLKKTHQFLFPRSKNLRSFQ